MFTGVRQACPALRGVASGRSRTFRIANRRGANRALSRLPREAALPRPTRLTWRRDLRSGECDRVSRGRISHSLNRRSSRSGPTAESPPAGSAIRRVRPDDLQVSIPEQSGRATREPVVQWVLQPRSDSAFSVRSCAAALQCAVRSAMQMCRTSGIRRPRVCSPSPRTMRGRGRSPRWSTSCCTATR